MKPHSVVVLAAIIVLLLSPQSTQAQSDVAAERVDALLATMTLEAKVAQMFMVNLFGPTLTNAGRDMLETWGPGAVVLLNSNVEDRPPVQVTDLVNSYQQTITDAGGVPLFVAVDQEGGLIQRLRTGFTTWPVPMLLTAAADADLAYAVGQGMAAELRAVGVNMNLAPVADLQTNRANPVIGRRSFGSYPTPVGDTLAALIQGMQVSGVMATVKHFPGHGDTDEDSHTTLPVLDLNRARMDVIELPPFVAAIEAEVGAVMGAHIWFPALEPTESLPASLSTNIMGALLRDDLGYEGIAITDALDMDAIDTVYSPENAAIQAIIAGNDMILIGANAGEAIQARSMQAVVDAVRAGEISEARIDESVRRILAAKARFGVLDWQPAPSPPQMPTEANAALVEEIFNAGVTVARDEAGLLPLEDDSSVGIAFPGTRYGIRAACEGYADGVNWLAFNGSPTQADVAAARGLAQRVDVMIVFTRDVDFDPAQADLVNALPPDKTVVVALQSVYDLLAFPEISTYVLTYSPLDPALDAACAALFGAIAPSTRAAVDLDQPPTQ